MLLAYVSHCSPITSHLLTFRLKLIFHAKLPKKKKKTQLTPPLDILIKI